MGRTVRREAESPVVERCLESILNCLTSRFLSGLEGLGIQTALPKPEVSFMPRMDHHDISGSAAFIPHVCPLVALPNGPLDVKAGSAFPTALSVHDSLPFGGSALSPDRDQALVSHLPKDTANHVPATPPAIF